MLEKISTVLPDSDSNEGPFYFSLLPNTDLVFAISVYTNTLIFVIKTYV